MTPHGLNGLLLATDDAVVDYLDDLELVHGNETLDGELAIEITTHALELGDHLQRLIAAIDNLTGDAR